MNFLKPAACCSILLLAVMALSTARLNAEPSALTGLAAKLDHHLVVLDHGALKPFDAASLSKVKYFAFYYSASWCPPCRIFTPKLVDFYKSFKPEHPNFELIFVDQDPDPDAMLAYMKGDAMPWPTVRFEDVDSITADQDHGEYIPDLMLVSADGKVLYHSTAGPDYVEPGQVLNEIKSLVH